MNRVELKQNAKNSLNDKYGDTILMIIIYALISGCVGGTVGFICGFINIDKQITTSISTIIGFIISALFEFGFNSYFLKISRNEEVTKDELFSKTKFFLPYILISILVSIFTTLWSLLLIIPGIIAALSYSMVYFIKLDNPEMDALEVIKESKKIMKGHKMDYFILNLSFIGWILLGILTLGILYIWLIPYMSVTQANFYNSIIKEQK